MTNDLLVKKVRGTEYRDQVFWLFYREGNISNPLCVISDVHAQKVAKKILGIPEDREIVRVDHPISNEPEMCHWCKKEEATNAICHHCWRRLD